MRLSLRPWLMMLFLYPWLVVDLAHTQPLASASNDASTDRPGLRHLILPSDLPAPFATEPRSAEGLGAVLGIAFLPPSPAPEFVYMTETGRMVALHGSWNRATRTGSKVIRLPPGRGMPNGGYSEFLAGFVTPGGDVWKRPLHVAVAHDGVILVTEDANNTIWRIAPR